MSGFRGLAGLSQAQVDTRVLAGMYGAAVQLRGVSADRVSLPPATDTPLLFATTAYTVGAITADPTRGYITVGTSGFYALSACVRYGSGTADTARYAAIHVQGTPLTLASSVARIAANGYPPAALSEVFSLSGEAHLSPAQSVSVWGFTGGAVAVPLSDPFLEWTFTVRLLAPDRFQTGGGHPPIF